MTAKAPDPTVGWLLDALQYSGAAAETLAALIGWGFLQPDSEAIG